MKRWDVLAVLRGWFERIRLTLFLHPEFDAGRRWLMVGSAAVVAANVLVALPSTTGLVPSMGSISAELTAVTRRAFLPRVYVQLWQSNPLMAELLRNA